MNRRNLLKWMFRGTIFTWVVGLIGSVLAYIKFPKEKRNYFGKEIEVGDYGNLKVGDGKFISQFKEPMWLIKTPGGLIALSAFCTHMRCILEYKSSEKVIKCPCHGAIYDLSGNVLSGPPPRPLKKYRVEVKGDKVYVIYG